MALPGGSAAIEKAGGDGRHVVLDAGKDWVMKLGTLCYVRQSGRTLMLYRNKKPQDFHEGKWNGLGGKLELGETPEECVQREVQEESGLTIQSPVLHGILTFPAFDEVDDWYVFVYTADCFCGELIDSPEGELAWIADGKLMDLNLWQGDRIFLPWIGSGRFFSGKFVYRKGSLVEHEVTFYPFRRENSGTADTI